MQEFACSISRKDLQDLADLAMQVYRTQMSFHSHIFVRLGIVCTLGGSTPSRTHRQ